ncbi:MAG: NUDIX hydrolase [Planctomycetes bacterium]|nr:NUDIX hydrolase [Planctomycetota bacterium]
MARAADLPSDPPGAEPAVRIGHGPDGAAAASDGLPAWCPRCGEHMDRRPAFGRSRPVCVACGLVHFETTATAAVAVVAHGRRVLLVRRAISPYRGQWSFPGGFQEHGEELAETAVRETREEAGLDVDVVRALFVGLTRDDPRKLVNVVVFLARPRGDQLDVDARIAAADDASDVRFFDLEAVPLELAFENSRRVLDHLRREFPVGPIG